MHVISYPARVRWSTRHAPEPHRIPWWRRPTRHPNRPVRLHLRVAAPLVAVALAVTGCASTPTPVRTEVPAACTDALDAADTAFGVAADAFSASADAMDAAAALDVYAMDRATDHMDRLKPRLKSAMQHYADARDECRGLAR